MPWKKYDLRGQTVFARVLPTGKPIVRRGRTEVRYKLGATKSYRASPENLEPVEGENEGEIISDAEFSGTPNKPTGNAAMREIPNKPASADTIVIYTDGACSGNPGPAGIGVFLQRPTETVEICEYIGSATNNIAELMAILRALETLTEAENEAHIHLFTDSSWCLGVLVGGWKAKTNLTHINKIKEQLARFTDIEMLKVKGHAGIPGNEEADYLATTAARREESKPTRVKPRRQAT